MRKIFPWLASRTFWIYIIIFLLLVTVVDQDKMKTRVLNFLTQPIDYLIYYSEGQEPFNRQAFDEYIHYYQTFAEYLPDTAAAYGMLGFCSYQIGKEEEAVNYYKRAVELQPDFFWFNFDLGLIYLNQNKFREAAESFQKALAANPKKDLLVMRTSRILGFIENQEKFKKFYAGENASIEEILMARWRATYSDAQKLLVVSMQLTNHGPDAKSKFSFKLKVF